MAEAVEMSPGTPDPAPRRPRRRAPAAAASAIEVAIDAALAVPAAEPASAPPTARTAPAARRRRPATADGISGTVALAEAVGPACGPEFRDLLGQAAGIRLDSVSRWFRAGDSRVEAVREVSLEIAPGEFVAIVGPSGCGKSTLLALMGGLDRPTSGHVYAAGQALDQLGDAALADYRLQRVGTVFQNFNLVPSRTAADNVALPLALAGMAAPDRQARAHRLLELVGLRHRAGFRAARLAGGEQQRVAVARALAARPGLLLADEPTGSLDSAGGRQVLALLRDLHRRGATLVVVTHDPDVAAHAERVVRMRDGRVVSERRQARRRTRVAPAALEAPARLSSADAVRIGLDAVGRRPLRTALTAAGAALGMALTSLVLSLAGAGRPTGYLAAIALAVAGFGIVNTMYTSVLERTREVGVLKAVGARFRDVALIFVAEGGVMGLAAGVLGAVAAAVLAGAGNRLAGAEVFRTGPGVVFLTVALGTTLGLVAGVAPALRAASQDPMTALRAE